MPHFLGISSKKPNAAQKRQLIRDLREFDRDLTLCVGSQPGEAACYVEAPDYYGSMSVDMTEKRNAVRAIVSKYLPA